MLRVIHSVHWQYRASTGQMHYKVRQTQRRPVAVIADKQLELVLNVCHGLVKVPGTFLDFSYLAERAPDPRSSSLPWGRRSPTPERWAETADATCPFLAARAAGRDAGPASPLLPGNARGSGTGTDGGRDSINDQWPSVMADRWKGSWTIQNSSCLKVS